MNLLKATNFIRWAMDNPVPETEVFTLGEIYIESRRQNDKHPASMTIMTPDEWIKNIRGTDKLQDVYLLMKFPREQWEQYTSPIIRPDEVIDGA